MSGRGLDDVRAAVCHDENNIAQSGRASQRINGISRQNPRSVSGLGAS